MHSMLKKLGLVALLALGLSNTVLADPASPGLHTDRPIQESCSGHLTEWDAEQLRALEATGIYDNPDPSRETGTYLVYLAFHIVRTTSGTGGIPQSQLDQAMIDLADAFAGTGICFTVALQDTINSSTYYTIDNDTERATLKGLNNQPDMIDCYFVNYDGGYCGVSSFTWSSDQGITYDNGCVGVPDNPSTFPHEIGHYFNLLHTHEPFYGAECPDGSNCGSAGDLVCDTPADPELGSGNVNTSCVYTGNTLVFCNGQLRSYNPDPENIMSYSRKECRTVFSAGQRSRMITTLLVERWGEVGFGAPDFDFSTPANWSNALVPRNTTGANSASSLVTSTLPGNSNTTWLNQALRQANTSSHNPGVYGRIFLDNSYFWWYAYNGGTWSGQQYYNNFGPITVRGGRHSIHSQVDVFDEVCETNESDNLRYTQWVWSPYGLATEESVQRSNPPEKMTSQYTYANSDGLQFTGAHWWSAVAIQPLTSTADFDINLHEGYAGSTTGFASTLAVSAYGSGSPDWVIVNHNATGFGGNYETGIVNFDGEPGNVRVHRTGSTTHTKTDGTRICGVLGANEILDVIEVNFNSADIADSWTVSLTSDDPADLDFYLYPTGVEYLSRSGFLEASLTGGSSAETITLTANTDLATTGWYAFVVAKRGLDDLGEGVAYEVKFTNNSYKMSIAPTATSTVALFQDGDPYGGSEWRNQLTSQGITHTVFTTAQLASVNLDDYGMVIVPTPVGSTSHANIQANLSRLDEYNDRGGVLVQGTATSSNTSGFNTAGGVTATWATCGEVHPTSSMLVTGVGADAPGSSATHHVLTVPGAGWSTLATSDCDGLPVMVVHEGDGLLVFGAPMEHSIQFFDCSLGESIENIVAWGYDRARRTIRTTASNQAPAFGINRTYNKNLLTSLTYTNLETAAWLSVSPVSGTIPVLDSGDPITFTFNPAGLTTGVHRADVTVSHNLYNTPLTVYTYLDIAPRTPAVPLNLTMVPVDFSPGLAIVFASWDPVTTDINGFPLVVDTYYLYYGDDPYFATASVVPFSGTSSNLNYHSVGLTDRGFLRVTAVDADGVLVADSHPGLPLPTSVVPGDARFLSAPPLEQPTR
jgi:hypothetical protein